MAQLVIRHYEKPAARQHLLIGVLMATVGLGFGINESLTWLAPTQWRHKGYRPACSPERRPDLARFRCFFCVDRNPR